LPSKKKDADLRLAFGSHVRLLRKKRQLTQEQLAELASISVDFLSLIERGCNSPSFKNLGALANALGTSVASLFAFLKGGTR
jgi:transcriptional regulator with XRE-family HTH domain